MSARSWADRPPAAFSARGRSVAHYPQHVQCGVDGELRQILVDRPGRQERAGPDPRPARCRPHRRHVSFGQLYVALSRCTSINGLVLRRPVLPKDLKTDRRIARFLNATVSQNQNRRLCAISILTVGEEGRMSRPRPVELADARQAYGITACDVLLAPALLEAWGVIAPMLTGCTPVGLGIEKHWASSTSN
jgi:hypothetical protein